MASFAHTLRKITLNPHLILTINHDDPHYYEYCSLSIRLNAKCIAYVNKPTYEMIMLSLSVDSGNIVYIKREYIDEDTKAAIVLTFSDVDFSKTGLYHDAHKQGTARN